jgi:hypothetical protein
VEKFKFIFEGLDVAYGQHRSDGERADGKQEGKSFIVKKLLDNDLWQNHLDGKGPSLGIIPIMTDNTAKWGCIDIDVYPIDYQKLINNIRKLHLPLVPCRSKSGGVHLFLFLKQKISAKLVRNKLREVAAFIGYSTAEVFPKQSSILISKGDYGNFLNLPYYDSKKTRRYAYKDDGTAATYQEFLDLYEHHVVEEISKVTVKILEGVIKDGPPCLQQLCTQGFPEGTRNNGLFNIGVYLRKFDADNWKTLLEQHNRDYMKPPLAAQEVVIVQKQLEKKSYHYKCKEPPINTYCNATLCRTRKHGIQGDNGPIDITSLAKLDTNPPVWFLQVGDDARLELQTEELQIQHKFQRACMNTLNKMPPIVKPSVWQETITRLLDKQTVITVSDDGSVAGQFEAYLQEFCTDRVQALNRDEILMRRPWTEERKTWFRLNDLQDYLTRKKFNYYNPGQVIVRLRDLQDRPLTEGEREKLTDEDRSTRWNLKGKTARVWWVPAFPKQDSDFKIKELDEIPF